MSSLQCRYEVQNYKRYSECLIEKIYKSFAFGPYTAHHPSIRKLLSITFYLVCDKFLPGTMVIEISIIVLETTEIDINSHSTVALFNYKENRIKLRVC